MFVAAEAFSAATTCGVYTHFKREEDATMVRGKFDEELHRMSQIGRRIRPHSLLLCNESFAATNEREAADIAFEIIRAMNHAGIGVGYVTHLYELSHRLYVHHRDGTLFLRAERDPDGRRPYRIIEAEPLSTSYGEDVYRQIFGENSAESGEV
jgi:DNA mismatch repair ATPase MutS